MATYTHTQTSVTVAMVMTLMLTLTVISRVQGEVSAVEKTKEMNMMSSSSIGPKYSTKAKPDEEHSNHSNTKNHSSSDSHGNGHADDKIHVVSINFEHVKTPLIFGLVVIIAGISKIGYHHADFLSTKVPESCILILLGIILGGIIELSGAGQDLDFFQPHEFFLYLLPPIILEAAFSLHDRTFSENLGSIILFSVVGTIIACFAIGFSLMGLAAVGAMKDPECTPVQILVFSALIVAVDPVAVLAIFQEVGVNNMLYFIVFGESLFNDGVTVVLYNVMQTYNRMDHIEADQIVLGIVKFFVVVFGGISVGVLLGLLSSFLTKFTQSVKVTEPIIIFGFAYQSYILAEMFHFSGIISIIACGLVQMQYAFNNITNKSKLACKFFAKVISNTCEIIIFLFLGLKCVKRDHEWNTGFVLWTTLLCIVYRFIITYSMSILINKCDTYRVRKIKFDEMFMISYGGLRGAVCFSLVALLDPSEFKMKNMFLTTTLFVIFFTVFIQGGSIKWLVKKMRVSLAQSTKDMILYQELNQHVSDHLMAGIEEILGYSGKYTLREKFDNLDNKFMRPIFLLDPNKSDVGDISQYYEKLMMKEHYKNLKLCGVSNLPHVESDLRNVDSSACLRVMDDDDEQKALERSEHRIERRNRLASMKSQKSVDQGEADIHKMFRDALVSSQNRANRKFHDKNFVLDEKRHIVGQLRHKYKRNQRLSRIGSVCKEPVQRALSWDENNTALTVRRTSDTKLSARAVGRCHTVDLSPSTPPDDEPVSPLFHLENTVFEHEEETIEDKPLLEGREQKPGTGKDLHVKFEGLDKTSAPEGKTAGSHLQHAESHHAGQLLRQDAMKDADTSLDMETIQLHDIKGKPKDVVERQKSV